VQKKGSYAMPAPNGNIHAYNGTRGGKDSDQDEADKGKARQGATYKDV